MEIDSIVLIEIGKIIIPFIQLFGVYIIIFGHISPGGGFAGGTIVGVSLILYRLIYGKSLTEERLNYSILIKYISFSMIFYGVLKGYSFITGGSYLHAPTIPLGTPGSIISGGLLLPLNIVVGIVVSITVFFLFRLFYEGEI